MTLYDCRTLEQGNYKMTGTLLKRYPAAHNGNRLMLFLREWGPLWVFAPGHTSGKGRVSGYIEPLTWGVFDIYQGPRSISVRSVDVREDFFQLRRSHSRLLLALEWARLLSDQLIPSCSQDDLLVLYWNGLKQLEQSIDPFLVDFRFLWRWAKIVGQAPSLIYCSVCGGKVDQGAYGMDGLVCTGCMEKEMGVSPISAAVLRILRYAAMLKGEEFRTWGAKQTVENKYWVYSEWQKSFLRISR